MVKEFVMDMVRIRREYVMMDFAFWLMMVVAPEQDRPPEMLIEWAFLGLLFAVWLYLLNYDCLI
ncbi:hypothetical protein [uncultured Robinsoniella sp.]|uniref:hypothetical protein n=1 Tax=uncultured Robinsoniella sp. TaxID=904190 RepID=UPI00374E2AEF